MWWIYLQFLCLIFVILAAGYEEEILQTGPSPATETPHSTPELSSRFFISCKSKVPNQFLHGEQYLLLPDEGCGCRPAHWISAHLSATYPDSLLPTDNSNCSLPLLHSRCTPASSSLLTWYYLSVYSRSPIWKHMWIKVKDLSLTPHCTAIIRNRSSANPQCLTVNEVAVLEVSIYTRMCSCWIPCLLSFQLHRHIWTQPLQTQLPSGPISHEDQAWDNGATACNFINSK